MPLDADHIRALVLPPSETVVTDRDAMLYALSIGLGRDPLDAHDLSYVYERDLKVFPTMPIVVGHPGSAWQTDPASGITRAMVVHGAQRLWSYRPLPLGRPLVTVNRVTDIWDKGDRGAIVELERETREATGGEVIARSISSIFCRADGGFGGPSGPAYAFAPLPDRAPDRSAERPTEASMALLYRLNNDRNPLHADPAVATRAGFSRPILHGLATYGVAAAAIARAFPDARLTAIETRFSRPVLPGETVTIDMWDEPGGVAFRARVAARDAVVLDRGRATLS